MVTGMTKAKNAATSGATTPLVCGTASTAAKTSAPMTRADVEREPGPLPAAAAG